MVDAEEELDQVKKLYIRTCEGIEKNEKFMKEMIENELKKEVCWVFKRENLCLLFLFW